MLCISGYMTLFVWLFYAKMKLMPSNISKILGGEQKIVLITEKQAM